MPGLIRLGRTVTGRALELDPFFASAHIADGSHEIREIHSAIWNADTIAWTTCEGVRRRSHGGIVQRTGWSAGR